MVTKTTWHEDHKNVPIPTRRDWLTIYERFHKNPFVSAVEHKLQENGNLDFIYSRGGVRVYTEKIVTHTATFRYDEWHMLNLTLEECWALACYFGDGLGTGCKAVIRSLWDDKASQSRTRIGYMVFLRA